MIGTFTAFLALRRTEFRRKNEFFVLNFFAKDGFFLFFLAKTNRFTNFYSMPTLLDKKLADEKPIIKTEHDSVRTHQYLRWVLYFTLDLNHRKKEKNEIKDISF
jgi:hypothetical protein